VKSDRSKFLTADWRYLAMLNYEVDPAILTPFIPRGTELDQWHGKTFVSVVGFLFQNTRIRGLPIPFHRNFEEVNFRFYVRRLSNDGWRRAVVFIREMVPRWAIVWTARIIYNENYISLPMSHHFAADQDGSISGVSYEWKHKGKRNCLELIVKGQAATTEAGSQEEFITEHYWGYARQRDGGTLEYKVEHPKWRVWSTQSTRLDCDVRALYGDEFVGSLEKPPTSAFLADGSAVAVLKGQRLT
jgi:uncharacterized protein YqjF (DUF2071 family)